ncbi:MAG: diheme cytochrome c [Deltaproteobacteria bacterium]|nr:diheme cytochrome c [Deltaproteobacteria bacterium]
MSPPHAMRLACLAALLVLAWPGPGLWADGRHEREEREHQERHGRSRSGAAVNPLYQERCGGCHLAYQPWLLPVASWNLLLGRLPEHFGEQVELSPADRQSLGAYLAAEAVDQASGEIPRKIRRRLGSGVPERITESAYWRHKHEDDDLPAGVFARKSVGSPANCQACHPGAAQGDYDDDRVRIPQ